MESDAANATVTAIAIATTTEAAPLPQLAAHPAANRVINIHKFACTICLLFNVVVALVN